MQGQIQEHFGGGAPHITAQYCNVNINYSRVLTVLLESIDCVSALLESIDTCINVCKSSIREYRSIFLTMFFTAVVRGGGGICPKCPILDPPLICMIVLEYIDLF